MRCLKLFSLMLLILTTSISLSSCSKNEDELIDIKSQIIGTWDATAIKSDNTWIDITDYPNLAISISFYEDGSYYGRGALGNGGGTYTVSDRKIYTYIDGELYCTYNIRYLSGSFAELVMYMGKSSMEIRAQKR